MSQNTSILKRPQRGGHLLGLSHAPFRALPCPTPLYSEPRTLQNEGTWGPTSQAVRHRDSTGSLGGQGSSRCPSGHRAPALGPGATQTVSSAHASAHEPKLTTNGCHSRRSRGSGGTFSPLQQLPAARPCAPGAPGHVCLSDLPESASLFLPPTHHTDSRPRSPKALG